MGRRHGYIIVPEYHKYAICGRICNYLERRIKNPYIDCISDRRFDNMNMDIDNFDSISDTRFDNMNMDFDNIINSLSKVCNLHVHGGVTYSGYGLQIKKQIQSKTKLNLDKCFVIGWDYYHYNDKDGKNDIIDELYSKCEKITFELIHSDVLKAIHDAKHYN